MGKYSNWHKDCTLHDALSCMINVAIIHNWIVFIMHIFSLKYICQDLKCTIPRNFGLVGLKKTATCHSILVLERRKSKVLLGENIVLQISGLWHLSRSSTVILWYKNDMLKRDHSHQAEAPLIFK